MLSLFHIQIIYYTILSVLRISISVFKLPLGLSVFFQCQHKGIQLSYTFWLIAIILSQNWYPTGYITCHELTTRHLLLLIQLTNSKGFQIFRNLSAISKMRWKYKRKARPQGKYAIYTTKIAKNHYMSSLQKLLTKNVRTYHYLN